MKDFLKKIPLFAELSDDDLIRLCEMSATLHLPAGEELFKEGEQGDQAYVIRKGEIEIYKESDNACILLAIRKAGEIIGEMSILGAIPRNASGRARTESELIVIGQEQLDELLQISPKAARTMLQTFSVRLKSMEITLQQREKMAQLGMLTAGITHELNNPAAAVARGSAQLVQALTDYQAALLEIAGFPLDDGQRQALDALAQAARQKPPAAQAHDPLARSDLQDQLEDWLAEHEIEPAWELAGELVDMGLTPEQLARLVAPFMEVTRPDGARPVPALLRWMGAAHLAESLLAEINQGASRMSEIIQSLKSYSFLDQAPMQIVDVHEGLENTVVMLRGLLKDGLTLRREYAEDLPRIQAYGSELNQVWTNLIANAIEAMDGQGEVTIRTALREQWVVVQIEDNGPGIPEALQAKLFSPFFTTKAVGKGAGLGLHISYNIVQKHSGDIRVFSTPGKTCFMVTLPIKPQPGGTDAIPVNAIG